jgi:hypothetical protein
MTGRAHLTQIAGLGEPFTVTGQKQRNGGFSVEILRECFLGVFPSVPAVPWNLVHLDQTPTIGSGPRLEGSFEAERKQWLVRWWVGRVAIGRREARKAQQRHTVSCCARVTYGA